MVSPETEDSPDPLPPARPLRSRQTGQNSNAPENSLPQLGQVRWGSVLMALTALQSQRQPQQYHARTKWCEIGQHGPRQAVVPWHEQSRLTVTVPRQITFRNKIPARSRPAPRKLSEITG